MDKFAGIKCECGGSWYNRTDSPKGTVFFLRTAKTPGIAVACVRCGRVGARRRTKDEAAEEWAMGRMTYGPVSED